MGKIQTAFLAGGEKWLLLAAEDTDAADALQVLSDFLPGRGWAAAELRCLPQDTPRHFDPVTLEGDAVGGPAVAVSQAAFARVGGLDALLPPQAALLDLSLRLTAAGEKLGYCPFAAVQAPAPQEDAAGYAAGLAAKAILARKYGTAELYRAQRRRYFAELRAPSRHFAGVRKALLRGLPQLLLGGIRERPSSAASWAEADRRREFRGVCPLVPFEERPLVSVVVRTCGRPTVLCHTLKCLRSQTYRNFEVVVIEDGPDQSSARIAQEVPDLPVRYYASQEHVGRGRAGNIGIEHAQGEFVCFLDDDDFFYPEYIELNLSRFFDGAQKDLVLSSITAAEVDVQSRDPFVFSVQRRYPVIFDHLNLMDMCVKCRIPMTGAMFRRSLYVQNGGMREDIDGDEDWAMWLRYWRTARRADDTRPDIPRAVSIFGYPSDPVQARRRLAGYEVFDDVMLADPTLCFVQDAEKVRGWVRQLKADLAHLAGLGRLQELTDTARPDKAAIPPVPESGSVTLTAAQINGLYHAVLLQARQAQAEGRLERWLQADRL